MAYSELANWDGSLDRLNAKSAARKGSTNNSTRHIAHADANIRVNSDPVDAYIIPQHEIDEFITADSVDGDCVIEERDESRAAANENKRKNVNVMGERSDSEREDESESERGGRSDASGWDTPNQHANASSGMDASDVETPVRVRKKRRRKEEDRNSRTMQEEIVITPHREPSPSARKPVSAPIDQDANSPARDQAGPSNAATQKNTRLKSGSVKRTYAGPRRIKDASGSSELTKPTSSTDKHRLAPTHNRQNDAAAAPEGRDAAADPLRLEGSSSRAPPRKGIKTHGLSSGSSRARPAVDGPSQSSNQQRKPAEHAKNPFYASLSNAINGQRRQSLKHAALLGKPKPPSSPSSPSSPSAPQAPPPEPTTQRRKRKGKDRADRGSFVCVLIPPWTFPVPREMFKSIDEHIAEEEAKEEKTRKKKSEKEKGKEMDRQKGKLKKKSKERQKEDEQEEVEVEDEPDDEDEDERQRKKDRRRERRREWMKQNQRVLAHSKHGSIAAKSSGKKAVAVGPPKRNLSLRDAIYVSSGSEAPIAGPSKITSSLSKRRTMGPDRRPAQDEEVVPIPIVSSSEDEHSSSDFVSPRKTRSKTTTTKPKPKPTPKRLKKKREEIVLSSDSDSETDVFLVENALIPSPSPHRRLAPSTPLPTPPRKSPAPKRSARLGKKEVTAERDNEPNQEDVPPGEETRKDGAGDSATVTVTKSSLREPSEIVIKPREPTAVIHGRSTQPRSPTLCPSRTPSHHATPSPSSRSTTLAVPEEHSLPGKDTKYEPKLEKNKARSSPKAGVPENSAEEDKGEENAEEDGTVCTSEDDENGEEVGEEGSETSSSADELDDVCHRCRNRNIYAKMKCVKVKHGRVCRLHFCHRCIVLFFPKIKFDAYSVSFVCPSCSGTCDCISCCKKRGDHSLEQHQTNRVRWETLGVTLFVSPQETRRRERAARGEVVPSTPEATKSKPKPSRKGKAKAAEPSVERERPVDIGKEAEDWIRRQSAGKRKVRAFIGGWQDAWGPTPFCVHEMDGVDFDAHAVSGMGKGKGKAVDPEMRLYIGDRKGLDRPFVRAEDVTVSVPDREPSPSPPPERQLGRPPKKRKLGPGVSVYTAPVDSLGKKKRRKTDQITIPEFTMNHQQDAVSSNATSPFYHQTPDDVRPFHGLEVNGEMKFPGITNDPMLGAIDGPYGSDPLSVDMYAPDWDSVAMAKPLATEGFGETDFSYQGTYKTYAAVLGESGSVGLEQFSFADAEKRLTELIDPALIEPEHDPSKAHEQKGNDYSDFESNPSRFLTPHAQASLTPTLMSVPTIFGVPSSTGLSLQDLQRTMRESLSALRSLA